jgi:DNA-directed RNA polymerase subunit beta
MAERLYFGKFEEVIEPPNLIEVQSRSYDEFLQKEVPPSERADAGLQAVFREVFPIKSYDEAIELDFVAYDIEDPKITSLDSLRNSESFSAALYVTFKLKDETGTKKERVYMGELPMMTRRGTFIINGAERVIVSQLHRSPGICFETSQHLNGKLLHSFRIIPDRGSWLEVQFDTNDLLYVYLDRRRRRRKFLATTFLRVLGYPTDRDIVSHFYSPEALPLAEAMDEGELGHKVPFEDILDGELVVAKAYEPLTIGIVRQLLALGHKTVEVIDGREDEILLKSLRKDPAKDEESALKDIYRKLRPGDPPTAANSRALLKRLFFDPKKYDLTRVGRYKINQKLGITVDSDQRIMVPEDFLAAVRYILKLKKGDGVIDDIDHLGSRRVRAVGELLANQCRVGLARTERCRHCVAHGRVVRAAQCPRRHAHVDRGEQRLAWIQDHTVTLINVPIHRIDRAFDRKFSIGGRGQIHPQHGVRARCRLHQRAQNGQQSAFPRPRRAEECRHVALRHGQVQPAQHPRGGIARAKGFHQI